MFSSKELHIILKSSLNFLEFCLILQKKKSTKNFVKIISGLEIDFNFFFSLWSSFTNIYVLKKNQLKILKLPFKDPKLCAI